jgi:hypothetical protein
MKKDNQFLKPKFNKIILYVILALGFCGIIWGISIFLPSAVDWQSTFRPAALKLVTGRSPYEIEGFFNPFWTLIPLIPIAIFPAQIGRGILFVVTLVSFTYTARHMGAKLLAILVILFSPPSIHGLLNGNIDWLVLLGLAFPPRIGLFFIMIKPQIGIAIIIFWIVEAWRNGGWKQVLHLIWPVSTVFLISIFLYGFWPLRSTREIDLWWNASLWPASIPVGLVLLTTALRKRKINYAMGASPCLSPYVLLHSWIIALYSIINSLPELIVSVLGLWLLVIIRAIY